MSTLPKDLRSKLERAVLAAREEATEGAAVALTALGVGDAKRPAHLDAAGEALRRRLRARGRQAGDRRKPDDSQETGHLVQECAYEHWHRMLFARFLAENELLRHPEMGVAVSLEECEELAREEGLDLWELAASFAQHMLPEVFRQDDPVLHLRLPTEARNKLTAILNELPSAVFTADDSLGWTYQFWQTKRKKEVNESGVKIGADEISPVTQLFTEDYMVEFLLHNTLGAWWAGKLGPITAASEEEARAKAALPERDGIGVTWTYLRFIQDEETKAWKPAAGSFEGWPKETKAITFLDPCMGSGHFPVFALPLLARLRMEEEGLSARDAICAVLRDNIHGLELDPRCTQIAAFNLALSAWRRVGHCPLPAMNLASSGLAPNTSEKDWLALAGNDPRLKFGMQSLHRLFAQAPVLGSLINPKSATGTGFSFEFHELQPLLEKALAQESGGDKRNDLSAEALAKQEMAVTARGLAKAAEILTSQFILVATNFPYLKRGNQDEELKKFATFFDEHSHAELATTFLVKTLSDLQRDGTLAVVTPQSLTYQRYYVRLRKRILEDNRLRFVAKLGPGAFETISGEIVQPILLIIDSQNPKTNHQLGYADFVRETHSIGKAKALKTGGLTLLNQKTLLESREHKISAAGETELPDLAKYCECYQGICTGDIPRFGSCFWEIPREENGWILQHSTPEDASEASGCTQVLFWENGNGVLYEQIVERLGEVGVSSWIRGLEAWDSQGVAIAQMQSLRSGHYTGKCFDSNTAVMIPKSPNNRAAVFEYCRSQEFRDAVLEIDQSIKISNKTLLKVPFDLAHWQKVAAEKYPDGLPAPYSSDPTQWLFNGHPAGADQPLHVAVARLLGYRWPRQTGSSVPDCPALDKADGLEAFADADGIVCLTSVRGEDNAAERLRALLRASLGTHDERQLIAAAGKKGSKSKSLEDWLRDEFFEQHCELFHQRPYIWHLWDGRKDGFHALVNYHQLAAPNGGGRRILETLTYGYLGDWITRQTDAVNQGESGADDRLAAALELKGLLEKILAGEPPYDLFVRWKPLHEQAIGWAPDLNDGVRLNARPFLANDLSRGKKGTGLFRSKVNLKWTKDRGNEPQRPKADFPWFWSWDEKTQDFAGGSKFDGNRWNDLHYTTATKQAARERQQKATSS